MLVRYSQLSQRLKRLAPSATAAVFGRAAELARGGTRIYGLHVGEPDFPTPEHVREAAKRAIDAGASRYTPVAGLAELREAIAADSTARRGSPSDPGEVVVSVGAKHALFNLAQALYDPGDEVIIPTPSWVSYAAQVELSGAKPVLLPCPSEDDFLARAEAIEAACTPRTKALVLCSPSNPTGQAYDADQLAAIAEVARRRGLWVVVDEIYGQLVYDEAPCPSILSVAPDLKERVVVVDGVSKAYAMTGWRIGWSIAPRVVASACEAFQSQVTTNATAVAQHAALAALTGPREPVEAMRQAYQARRDRMLAALTAAGCGGARPPRGAFYVLCDVRPWLRMPAARAQGISSDLELASYLLERSQVAVVPGSPFGAPGYLRLSFATSPETIDEGVARLGEVLSQLEAAG